jgi:hypothetical protein
MGIGYLLLIAALQAIPQGADEPDGLPFEGRAAEEFLRTAAILEVEEFDSRGITKPRKVTLSDGQHTVYAVLKDIDVVNPRVKLNTGRTVFKLTDSYRHEIAAYELDRILGLGLVPPTVERRVGPTTGSLTLWVYGAMTEWHRRKMYRTKPPDPSRWDRQMDAVALINYLTNDVDAANTLNILIDGQWRIYKIDFSRAFHPKFRLNLDLNRFPREALQALQALERSQLEASLGPWLGQDEFDALWQRVLAVVELADELIADRGEASVVFD